MTFRSACGSVKRYALSRVRRKEIQLSLSRPIISFTFDDIHHSACYVGAGMLGHYGAVGTFYLSMGMMETFATPSSHFSEQEVRILVEEGHELGSHTFRHVSCRKTSSAHFLDDALAGQVAVNRYARGISGNFSYPFDHVTA